MRASAPLLIIAAVLAAFLTLDAATPLLRPFGTVLGLDGSPGIIDHPDLWADMDPLSRTSYWLGDLFCHQDEARTLILNGNEMPVCIRDVALMASLAAGLVAASRLWDVASRMDGRMILACALLVAVTPVEWAIEGALDIDSPALRVIVSVPTGIGGAFLVARLLGMELGRSSAM